MIDEKPRNEADPCDQEGARAHYHLSRLAAIHDAAEEYGDAVQVEEAFAAECRVLQKGTADIDKRLQLEAVSRHPEADQHLRDEVLRGAYKRLEFNDAVADAAMDEIEKLRQKYWKGAP